MIRLNRRELLKHMAACACSTAALKLLRPGIIVGEALADSPQSGRCVVIIEQNGGVDGLRFCPPRVADDDLRTKIAQRRSPYTPEGYITYVNPPTYDVFSQTGVPGLHQNLGTVMRDRFIAGDGILIGRAGAKFSSTDDDRSHAVRSNQMAYGRHFFNEQSSEGVLAKARRLFGLDVYQVFHFGEWKPDCRAIDDQYTPISAIKASDLVYQDLNVQFGGASEKALALDTAKKLWEIRKHTSSELDFRIANSLQRMDAATVYFQPIVNIPVGTGYNNIFGESLKGATQLLINNASLPTPKNLIIQVILPNWDSHSDFPGLDNLIATLGSNLGAMITDLISHNIWNDTVIVSRTEFGRQCFINGSGGTDHGKGGPQFVLGGSVNGGFRGAPFTAGELAQEALDVEICFQNVFSQIYSWMGFDSGAIAEIYPPSEYQHENLNLFS